MYRNARLASNLQARKNTAPSVDLNGGMFANLLTSSAKCAPKAVRIWLCAERKGDEVEVSVRDSGIAIPAANRKPQYASVGRTVGRTEAHSWRRS
jgi:K+-sensing histidine kinase KdpD